MEECLPVINNIKTLCVDVVEKAKSGHPGMPLGVSQCLFILFTKYLNINPDEPDHFQRDRFILSNGHGCAILYVLLHLLGFNYSMDDLKSFRQLHSKTPGHPEYDPKLGIDASTGPLGQGIANGVGQAIAAKKLGLKNKIVVMCGDGCLMEGISYEATSLAGHLKLDNLLLIYDDNKITIDGSTELSFSEDVEKRFLALNWNVEIIQEGNTDLRLIDEAFASHFHFQVRPTLIILKTKIGHESLLEGQAKSHGAPLGAEAVKELKTKFGFDVDKDFQVRPETISYFETVKKSKKETFFNKIIPGLVPPQLDVENIIENIKSLDLKKDTYATRELSGLYLNEMIKHSPNIIIGSADLGSSNKTLIKNENIQEGDFSKLYLNYGIREHAMVGLANGMTTYGILPVVSTFLVFLSYCYGALRLSALVKHKVLFVFTHDSFYVGEDGPTHQPIESISLLRSIPNLLVFRPADHNEVIGCYREALRYDGPSCMILSRQSLPMLSNTSSEKVKNGGYFIHEAENSKVILLATGSELSLAMEVANECSNVSVFSMPCLELFHQQSEEYQNILFGSEQRIFTIEASINKDFLHMCHGSFGVKKFGESAPAGDLKKYFKFTKEDVLLQVQKYI